MHCVLESATIGVSDLAASLGLFHDEIGLSVVNDARASVSLLSVWRRPVHESVRLVELASETASAGRVRLACYEDFPPQPQPSSPSAGRTLLNLTATTPGPCAIDFRAFDRLDSAFEEATVVLAPESLPLILPAKAEHRAKDAPPPGESQGHMAHLGAVSAIWIVTNDAAAAVRFYSEALGFKVAQELAVDQQHQELQSFLHGFGAAQVRLICLQSADPAGVRVVLVDFGPDRASAPPREMRTGELGPNLLTCRCDDLDEVVKRLETLGIQPITSPTHVGLPGGIPGRVMLVKGPNGELFEIEEIPV